MCTVECTAGPALGDDEDDDSDASGDDDSDEPNFLQQIRAAAVAGMAENLGVFDASGDDSDGPPLDIMTMMQQVRAAEAASAANAAKLTRQVAEVTEQICVYERTALAAAAAAGGQDPAAAATGAPRTDGAAGSKRTRMD